MRSKQKPELLFLPKVYYRTILYSQDYILYTIRRLWYIFNIELNNTFNVTFCLFFNKYINSANQFETKFTSLMNWGS